MPLIAMRLLSAARSTILKRILMFHGLFNIRRWPFQCLRTVHCHTTRAVSTIAIETRVNNVIYSVTGETNGSAPQLTLNTLAMYGGRHGWQSLYLCVENKETAAITRTERQFIDRPNKLGTVSSCNVLCSESNGHIDMCNVPYLAEVASNYINVCCFFQIFLQYTVYFLLLILWLQRNTNMMLCVVLCWFGQRYI